MNTQQSRTSLVSRISLGNWVALVLAVIAAIFILQNRESAAIHLFWVEIESPLWFVLLLVFGAGWMTGWLTNRKKSPRKDTRVSTPPTATP